MAGSSDQTLKSSKDNPKTASGEVDDGSTKILGEPRYPETGVATEEGGGVRFDIGEKQVDTFEGLRGGENRVPH